MENPITGEGKECIIKLFNEKSIPIMLVEKVISNLLSICKVTRWNNYVVDIIASSGGKISGIKEYLRKNNIKREETMAFGDGENDIDMLKYVHIGVAMGNADDYVKENADYITDSVDNNDIRKALLALKVI